MKPILTPEQLAQLTYEELLTLWRQAPLGDKQFEKKVNEFLLILHRKELELPVEDVLAISQRVGWR